MVLVVWARLEASERGSVAVQGQRARVGARGSEGDEAAIARAPQLSADLLRLPAVDDHAARRGVEDRDLEAASETFGLAAEGLDGDLEVDDRRRREAGPRYRCRVRDDPLVGVGRDIGLRLEDLAGAEGEGGREEGVAALVRRKVLQARTQPPDVTGVLRAFAVDEARLANARRVELFQVVHRLLAFANRGTARLDLGEARAALGVEVAKSGVVRGNQHDRARTLEVAFHAARVFVDPVRQRVIERDALLAPLAHAEGGAAREEQDSEHEGEKRGRTHMGLIGVSPTCATSPDGGRRSGSAAGGEPGQLSRSWHLGAAPFPAPLGEIDERRTRLARGHCDHARAPVLAHPGT
jgi:hypothetical protein